jgi:hypothetical protein
VISDHSTSFVTQVSPLVRDVTRSDIGIGSITLAEPRPAVAERARQKRESDSLSDESPPRAQTIVDPSSHSGDDDSDKAGGQR